MLPCTLYLVLSKASPPGRLDLAVCAGDCEHGSEPHAVNEICSSTMTLLKLTAGVHARMLSYMQQQHVKVVM